MSENGLSEYFKTCRQLLKTGFPVILTQLLQMSMGTVDTLMCGRYGELDLAAVSIGSGYMMFFMMFGFGILSCIQMKTAQYYGANKSHLLWNLLRHGTAISIFCYFLSMIGVAGAKWVIQLVGMDQYVSEMTLQYIYVFQWGLLPLFFSVNLRAYFDGLGRTHYSTIVVSVALLFNIIGNYVLIWGYWGMPEMGGVGSAWASVASNWASFIMFLVLLVRNQDQFSSEKAFFLSRLSIPYLKQLFRLGGPVAVGLAIEISLFVIVTILMGRWGAQTVAAHQIALNYGSMMFMVPLGMSVALTTHIGQALGAREFHKMEVISISGMFMAMCFMFLSANIIILFDQEIPHLYTNEPELIQAATTFILWAAIFQPVDGMQVIFQGALRGMQDTLIPFINCLVSYVFVGFPVGYYVCWEMEVGPEGLWTGMTSGLFCSCILNGARLYFRLRPYRIKTSKDVEMMP